MKKVSITFTVDPDVIRKIRELAKKDCRSLSSYIEWLLTQAVQK